MRDKERRKNKSSDHLISVYLKLKKDEHEENERDRTDVWIRAFLRFCVVLYGFFVLDILLPAIEKEDVITGISYSRTISGSGEDLHDGFNHVMKAMTIHTGLGHLTTLAVTGYEEPGVEVIVGQSILFKRIKFIYIGHFPYAVTPAIDFYGWSSYMPVLALLLSIWGGFVSRRLSSVLFAGALNVLFLLPFIMLLYLL